MGTLSSPRGKFFKLDSYVFKFSYVVLDCIFLALLSLINPQLTLTHFSLLIKTTNNILVEVKLKERIDLGTYKEKLAGLPHKTIKISFPTTKSSTLELPAMISTGMKPSMEQYLPS